MKINKSKLRQIIKEELSKFEEAYEGRPGRDELPQYASAAGAKQDIDMRAKRGSFEKGDFGIHSDSPDGWGEFKGYEEIPWVQMALEDLEDAEHDVKAKALEALADELGISIKQGYFEQKKK